MPGPCKGSAAYWNGSNHGRKKELPNYLADDWTTGARSRSIDKRARRPRHRLITRMGLVRRSGKMGNKQRTSPEVAPTNDQLHALGIVEAKRRKLGLLLDVGFRARSTKILRPADGQTDAGQKFSNLQRQVMTDSRLFDPNGGRVMGTWAVGRTDQLGGSNGAADKGKGSIPGGFSFRHKERHHQSPMRTQKRKRLEISTLK